MTYGEALDWLYGQQRHGIKLGLETMQRLCAELAIELASSPARPFFIHVAGTNGKGSVCAMLDSIYRRAGFRTGLYTSPHLVTFRERIRLNGEMISEAEVAEGLTRIRAASEGFEQAPTFFEIVTALALEWFQARDAELVVLETGLGGRLDATNVVTPLVSVLTSIDLDHERYLGTSLAEIAGEKCGIIKRDVPVVSGAQKPEVRAVIRATARACGSELLEAENAIDERLRIGLAGAHQRRNAAIACETITAVASRKPALSVPESAVVEGLAEVQWPGRFQRIGERIVLDGAHNPAAAATLVRTWKETFGTTKATVIIAVMRDKDVRAVVSTLASIARSVLTVEVSNERSCSAAELAAEVRAVTPSTEARACASLSDALRVAEASPEPILIAGSLFLVGEALVTLGGSAPAAERSEQ